MKKNNGSKKAVDYDFITGATCSACGQRMPVYRTEKPEEKDRHIVRFHKCMNPACGNFKVSIKSIQAEK